MKCPNCDSRDIDFQEAGGQSICMNCGTVVEENTIVSSIEFQETGDRSHVIGQFVAANCAKPFMSSSHIMGRHVDNKDSKEVSLLNARRIISHIVSQMRLPPLYTDRAHRLYQLAVMREVNAGRKQSYLVAACLYVVCRQDKSPHLLIDFSDALQVNVYSLGKAFLRLYRVINISLDVIDPSLYLHRYADKLPFGEAKHSVILTSLRVITRLKKDWIVTGRRPDGVCAAALLIASRAHEFDITQESIANLFHISFETVRKRIMEFRNTPSAQLTLQEFYALDDELQLEFDPPAFIRNQLEENETVELCLGDYAIEQEQFDVENETAENENETGEKQGFEVSDLVTDKVYVEDDEGDDSDSEKSIIFSDTPDQKQSRVLLTQEEKKGGKKMSVGGVTITVPFPHMGSTPRDPLHPRRGYKGGKGLFQSKSRDQHQLYREIYQEFDIPYTGSTHPHDTLEGDSDLEDEENETDNEQAAVSNNPYFQSKKGKNKLQERHLIIKLDLILHGNDPTSFTTSQHSSAVNKEETVTTGEDGLIPDEFLDDDEVANCLFNEDEKQKRTVLFNTTYGPFLEERERRRLAREGEANADSDRYTQTGKLRKKYQRKLLKEQQEAAVADGNTLTGAELKITAASQAISTARATIKAASKKINYEALQGVFDDNGSFALPMSRRPGNTAAAKPAASSSSSASRQQERELLALSGAAAASLFMQQQQQASDDFDSAGVGNKRKRGQQPKVALGGGQPASKMVKKEEPVPVALAIKQAEMAAGEMDQGGGYYDEDEYDYEDAHDIGDGDYDD